MRLRNKAIKAISLGVISLGTLAVSTDVEEPTIEEPETVPDLDIDLNEIETVENVLNRLEKDKEEQELKEFEERAERLREQRREERAERERKEQEERARAERLAKEQAEQANSESSNIVHANSTQANRHAETTKEETQAPQVAVQGSQYLMAQVVEAEARSEPYAGKVGVAEVIRNRVNSGDFPNTIEGVIYQSGQFQVVANGTVNNTPSKESINAVAEAMAGSNTVQGALFFYNPAIATLRFQDTIPTKVIIGNHHFS